MGRRQVLAGRFDRAQNRGLEDVFIFCVDGLTDFEEAIEAAYPQSLVQLCIVHMVRDSLRFVSWKDCKAAARGLKAIYWATTVEEARQQLDRFAQEWDEKYPTIGRLWRSCWDRVIPFFA